MSNAAHHRMQRVIVRMVHDPHFVDAVYRTQGGVLADLQLPPELLASLLHNPRAAFGTDAQRPLRLLKSLAEEYRVGTALLLAQKRSTTALTEFFRSTEFHEGIQTRGYGVLAFGAWLLRSCGAKASLQAARSVLSIEHAMALARRAVSPQRGGAAIPPGSAAAPEPGRDAAYEVVPGLSVAIVPEGTLAHLQAMEQFLFHLELHPHAALCNDAPVPGKLPPLHQTRLECWLADAATGISGIPVEHGRALQALLSGDAASIAAETLSDLVEHGLARRSAAQ